MLRDLAERALEGLGVKDTTRLRPGRDGSASSARSRRRSATERDNDARTSSGDSRGARPVRVGDGSASSVDSLRPYRVLLVSIRIAIIAARSRAAVRVAAQQPLVGYAPQSAAARTRDSRPAPSNGRRRPRRPHHSSALSRETHVAGTPAQARTRDYVIEQMKALGPRDRGRGRTTSGCRIRRRCASAARLAAAEGARASPSRRSRAIATSALCAVSDGQRLQRRKATRRAKSSM